MKGASVKVAILSFFFPDGLNFHHEKNRLPYHKVHGREQMTGQRLKYETFRNYFTQFQHTMVCGGDDDDDETHWHS